MRVLLLSPYPEKVAPVLEESGDEWTTSNEPLTDVNADWLISFGYRHIIREPHLTRFKSRIINVHISMLPWNRGSDPNFWSWFDRTPKGVSIHCVDAGVDSGDLLVQAETKFGPGMTLRTSYEVLMIQAVTLFRAEWGAIKRDAAPRMRVRGEGSYHRSSDKQQWWRYLSLGYDTPVAEVEELGLQATSLATTKR